jgi:hypothetical protein
MPSQSIKERLEQAKQEWLPKLAETLAQEKIAKKRLKNKKKIRAVKKTSVKRAENMIKSVDKGLRF